MNIQTMVNRFLGWTLPTDFSPDAGISFKPSEWVHAWPTGTNLFTAEQATAMFEYVLAHDIEDSVCDVCGEAIRAAEERGRASEEIGVLRAALAHNAQATPIPMVLHCPSCGMQHIDAPEESSVDRIEQAMRWTNPPHRSHLCHGCGTIWRPADVPTVGVEAILTRGKADKIVRAKPAQWLDEATQYCSRKQEFDSQIPLYRYMIATLQP